MARVVSLPQGHRGASWNRRVTREDATERYLQRLKHEAEDAGIDAVRVVAEARDHLIAARDRELASGRSPIEAEERALHLFGTANDIVSEIAASRKEGVMQTHVRRASTLIGLIGALALLAIHIVPSSAPPPGELPHMYIEDTVQGVIGALGLAAIGLAAIVLGFTARRAVLCGAVVTAVVGATGYLLATSALFSGTRVDNWPSWGSQPSFSDIAFYVLPLATVIGVMLLARRGQASHPLAIGLVLGGTVGLLLSSVRSPTAGLGGGDANIPVSLMLMGWCMFAGSQWSDNLVRWSAPLGRLLVRVGTHIEAPEGRAAAPKAAHQ